MNTAPIFSGITNSINIRNNTLLRKTISPISNQALVAQPVQKLDETTKRIETIGHFSTPKQQTRKQPELTKLQPVIPRESKQQERKPHFLRLDATRSCYTYCDLYTIPEDETECPALRLEIRNNDNQVVVDIGHRRNHAMNAATLGELLKQINSNKLDRGRRNYALNASLLWGCLEQVNLHELAVSDDLATM